MLFFRSLILKNYLCSHRHLCERIRAMSGKNQSFEFFEFSRESSNIFLDLLVTLADMLEIQTLDNLVLDFISGFIDFLHLKQTSVNIGSDGESQFLRIRKQALGLKINILHQKNKKILNKILKFSFETYIMDNFFNHFMTIANHFVQGIGCIFVHFIFSFEEFIAKLFQFILVCIQVIYHSPLKIAQGVSLIRLKICLVNC